MMRKWFALALLGWSLWSPSGIHAQPRAVGGEIRVNPSLEGDQWDPFVSAAPDATFFVAWQQQRVLSATELLSGIYAQRFDASGKRLGSELQLTADSGQRVGLNSLTHAPDGSIVVIWQRERPAKGNSELRGRRYDRDGVPLGPELDIFVGERGADEGLAEISHSPDGSFVVVSTCERLRPSRSFHIFARRFDRNGKPLGKEFQVDSYDGNRQGSASISHGPDGSFVVAWASERGPYFGIYAQRFDSSGARLGREFQVHLAPVKYQLETSSSHDSAGNFVIVWIDRPLRGSRNVSVQGRRFRPNGRPFGPDFAVSTATGGQRGYPVVRHDPQDGFMVVWTSTGQDGSGDGIYAQRFDRNAARVGREFRVNTQTDGHQRLHSFAFGRHGLLMVVWDTPDPADPDSLDVHGQFFEAPRVVVPVAATLGLGAQLLLFGWLVRWWVRRRRSASGRLRGLFQGTAAAFPN
jgi:hypothetical protein